MQQVILSLVPTLFVNFLALVYCAREFVYRRRYTEKPSVCVLSYLPNYLTSLTPVWISRIR